MDETKRKIITSKISISTLIRIKEKIAKDEFIFSVSGYIRGLVEDDLNNKYVTYEEVMDSFIAFGDVLSMLMDRVNSIETSAVILIKEEEIISRIEHLENKVD